MTHWPGNITSERSMYVQMTWAHHIRQEFRCYIDLDPHGSWQDNCVYDNHNFRNCEYVMESATVPMSSL